MTTKTAQKITEETWWINNCQTCKGEGMIECPSHTPAEDGWCATCDTPCDGEPAGRINCPCQG